MVFSKIPVFQIENKRLRTRQVTKAACRQDQSRLGFSTKSTVDTMKDFSILGSLFRPHIWAIKYHESTAIFLFHAGKKLVFGSFAWCNLLVVCKWRRWSDGNFELICGGTASVWNAALQLKAARYAGKAGKKARIFISRWRRSVWSLKTVLDTEILLENISLYNIYIYLWRWELKDQSPRLCHQKLTELTHVVSSGSRTIRWWAKEKSHRNVASVQSKRCKRTSSRQKLD